MAEGISLIKNAHLVNCVVVVIELKKWVLLLFLVVM